MSNEFTLNRRHLMLGASMAAASYVSSCAASESSTANAASETASTATAVKDTIDLTGISILITGCSSGFGRLGAEHYARLGAKVFATMRNLPRPEAAELEALATSDALDITVLEIDVTKDDQVEAGVNAAIKAVSYTHLTLPTIYSV